MMKDIGKTSNGGFILWICECGNRGSFRSDVVIKTQIQVKAVCLDCKKPLFDQDVIDLYTVLAPTMTREEFFKEIGIW